MKESMWGYLIVILGLVILAILMLVQRLTTTNEEDYYLSREVLKAAMLDAVDYGTYMKEPHKLVMSREKFVSVFIRRFADSVTPDKDYKIDFYDIHEYPPKATIRISTDTGETAINDQGVNLEINTFITGILETTDKDGLFVAFYDVKADIDNSGVTEIEDARIILRYADGGGWSGYATLTEADINKDGKVDIVDASIIERAVLSKFVQGNINMDKDNNIDKDDLDFLKNNINRLTKDQKIIADVNCDGKVNADDVSKLEKYIKGESVKFTCAKGDITGDGRITSYDLELLEEYLNNKSTLNTNQLKAIDLDSNNKVNKDDKDILMDWLLGRKKLNKEYSYN